MNHQALRRKREKLIQQLRDTGMTDDEIEQATGIAIQQDDVIDAEVVELPNEVPSSGTPTGVLGPESRHPSEDSTNRSPAETDPQASTLGPMDYREDGQNRRQEPAMCLPAVIPPVAPPRWSEEWWEQASPDVQARRCKAHKSNGQRCQKAAIVGARVCRTHGGGAPQVIAAARARLANAADAMASNLVGLAKTAESEAVRVRATEGVLDRVGIGRTTEVEVGPAKLKPYEEIFADIAGGSRAESRARRGIDDQAYTETYGYENGSEAGVDLGDPSRSFLDGYGEGGEHSEPSFHPPSQREPHTQPPMPSHPADSRPGRRRPPARPWDQALTDEDAIAAARQANEACGALPEQRALASNHKRYRRPW